MTPDERHRIFERTIALQNLTIDHAVERGRNYLIDRLNECRQKTDEIGQIAVQVKRALYKAKVARRNATALARFDSKHLDAKREAENDHDELKALEEAVNVCRTTLRFTDSDIRLAGALLGMAIGLGQFRPEDSVPVAPAIEDAEPADPATAPLDLVELVAPEAVREEPRKAAGSTTRPASTTTVVDDSAEIDLAALLS